ncbi:hypothetical protein BJX66DRAFT_341988 [Aspergillus keveii]|uniref:Uncharacterized protein n=1 Tax=Aspergillus keveii TaxID=714993 RepID=A0ABR4FTS9_9EURO
MFNQTLSLSIAQTALPGNAEGWTILLSDPNGAWQQMFNIARANEPGYVEVMTSATRTGTVPYNSSDIIWKLKVCYISQLDSEKVRAAASGVRPGKIPGECVVEVFKELEEQKVVFEGTARQAERGIETYKDSEWVLCASDSEEGYTTAEEGRKKKGNTK